MYDEGLCVVARFYLFFCCWNQVREAEPKVINHSWVALFGLGCVNPFHICTTLEKKKMLECETVLQQRERERGWCPI